jgi:hypothetical protein
MRGDGRSCDYVGSRNAEVYDGGIWWQMAVGGLLGGAARGGLDGWNLTNAWSNSNLLTKFTNTALTIFAKDLIKGSAYWGLNDKYSNKNSWRKTVFSTNGSGLNLGFEIASFFIGVAGR